MSPSLTTFLFELANFLTLAALLAWLFFKPVRKALENQQAKAKSREEEAERKLAEADKIKQEIDSQRKKLAAELESMRVQARETAKKESEAILAEARERGEQELALQRRQSLHIEKAQLAKIAQAVAGTAHSVIERLLEQIIGQELEEALYKSACQDLKDLAQHNSLAPVIVQSARPLADAVKQLIESALGGAKEQAEYRVDPELIAGLRIATAHGLVDASIAGLAQFAEQALQSEMLSAIREETGNE